MANLQIYSINQMLSEQHSQLTHLVNQTNSTKKSSIASLHIKSIKQLSEKQYSQPTYLIHQKVIRRTAKQVYTSSLSNKSCQKNNIVSLHIQSIKQKLSEEQHSQPTQLVHQTKVVKTTAQPAYTFSPSNKSCQKSSIPNLHIQSSEKHQPKQKNFQ